MKFPVVSYALVLFFLACTAEDSAKGGGTGSSGAAGKPTSQPSVSKNPDAEAGTAKPKVPAVEAGVEVPKPEPQPSPIDKYAHVDAEGAAKLLAADPAIKILDVRTSREFKGGHLKGAMNVDILVSSFEKKIAVMDKGTHYLVHCQSGKRSTSALHKFAKLGFDKVTHLDGGFAAWSKADQPVEK